MAIRHMLPVANGLNNAGLTELQLGPYPKGP